MQNMLPHCVHSLLSRLSHMCQPCFPANLSSFFLHEINKHYFLYTHISQKYGQWNIYIYASLRLYSICLIVVVHPHKNNITTFLVTSPLFSPILNILLLLLLFNYASYHDWVTHIYSCTVLASSWEETLIQTETSGEKSPSHHTEQAHHITFVMCVVCVCILHQPSPSISAAACCYFSFFFPNKPYSFILYSV